MEEPVYTPSGLVEQTDNSIRPEDGDQPASLEEALAAMVPEEEGE